jgi:hypothetical protein
MLGACVSYFTLPYDALYTVTGEYLLAERCPWSYDAYKAAEREGHTELLQWLVAHGCPNAKHKKQKKTHDKATVITM